jgi:hypothetical protein
MNQGFDKLTIADEMMESAIESYLDHKRYFAVLNLAGVAQEIYGKWIRINGGKDLPSQSMAILENVHKETGEEFERGKFIKLVNLPKNTIKHFDSVSDRCAILEPNLDCYIQLVEALAEHKHLNRPVTDNIARLEAYIRRSKVQPPTT